MKNTFANSKSNIKDNVGSAAVLAAIAIAFTASVFHVAAVATEPTPVVKMEPIVITGKRVPVVKLDTIVITAKRAAHSANVA